MSEFVKVGELPEFPEGQILARRVNERSVAVVRVGARVYAYANFCPHAGFTLSGGEASETGLVCDVHGAVFDLDSGAPTAGPSFLSLERYNVRLDGNDVLVARA